MKVLRIAGVMVAFGFAVGCATVREPAPVSFTLPQLEAMEAKAISLVKGISESYDESKPIRFDAVSGSRDRLVVTVPVKDATRSDSVVELTRQFVFKIDSGELVEEWRVLRVP